MKKITFILLLALLMLTSLTGCSGDKESAEELKAKIKAEIKSEIKTEIERENQLQAQQATKESIKGKIIAQEKLAPLDFDLLYFMDGDIDFLTMKGMGQPSEDTAYYIGTYGNNVEVRFYLSRDKYTINRITLISKSFMEEENYPEGIPSFMGLYLGMPIELAKDYIYTKSPHYDGELTVKYSDKEGDGIVHQIDVLSRKKSIQRIQREDFYFKFFDMNIHEEAAHLGNGTGAQETLKIDKDKRTYTYNIAFGADTYQKVYTYNAKNIISSMEIKSDKGEFLAVVPSLFGIQLGSEKDKINQMVKAANKTIHSSNPAKVKDGNYNVDEYTIIDNPSKIAYTAEIYTDKVTNRVKKVKGYFTHKTIISHDHFFGLLGTTIEGNHKKIEGTGIEQWVVDYEAYLDKIIKSAAIYNTEESLFVDSVPSLCGLQLNMFVIGVENTLLNNGYRVIASERWQPFVDKSLETVKYTVVDSKTNKEFNIYIVAKYIADISAEIVVRISI